MSQQPAPTALNPRRPFGSVLTAIVTPFMPDGALDLDAAAKLAAYLIDHGHDGLVVNGTTGESATTSDAEKIDVLRAVLEAVGDRATILAGVGSNDTRHSIESAVAAEKAGAHGVLVVAPYYNKPPQAGILAHFNAVADATGLPLLVYDIPGRAGVPIERDTMLRLAEHDRIVAVKDAKSDLFEAADVMANSDLAYYSGADEWNLAHLTQGGSGVVSVSGHVAGDQLRRMVDAVDACDLATAAAMHREMIPITKAIMQITQGAIMAKAGLELLGVLSNRAVRLPLLPASDEHVAAVAAALGR